MTDRSKPAGKAPKAKDTRNPLALWALTLSCAANPDLTSKDIILACKSLGKKWCFQKEKGKETDYLHWQIQLSTFKDVRKAQAVKLIRKTGWKFHEDSVTPMSNNGKDTVYAMKLDTRVEGPWCDKDKAPRYVQKRFRTQELMGWQQKICDMAYSHLTANHPTEWGDDRHIIVVQEPEGNVGKSFLKNFMYSHNQDCISVPSSMDSAEKIIQYLCDVVDEGREYCFVMDMPRATSPKHWWTICAGLETIKQGFLHDGRNHAVVKIIEPPAMVVFCNTLPPEGPMSKDVFIKVDLQALMDEDKRDAELDLAIEMAIEQEERASPVD